MSSPVPSDLEKHHKTSPDLQPVVDGEPVVQIQRDSLDQRVNAEDESVRDLRRHINNRLDLQSPLPVIPIPHSHSAPSPRMSRSILLNPEAGRLQDVAQPGGFRRHFVIKHANESHDVCLYAQTTLAQLLIPQISSVPEDHLEQELLLSEVSVVREGKASRFVSGVVIFKAFFGASFLMIPKGFQQAGLAGGIGTLVAMLIMELIGMLNIIKCREVKGPGFRYEDLGIALGSKGPQFIAFMIGLCQLGFAIVWLVFCSSNLSMILTQWDATHRLWCMLPLLVPFLWVRRLEVFAASFIVAILCTVVVVICLFGFGIEELSKDGMAPFRLVNTDILLWLGSSAYVYEGINCVLPIYEAAHDKASVGTLMVTIVSGITALYIIFGCVLYLTFGDRTADLATLNLPKGSMLGNALSGLFVLAGIITIPFPMVICFQTYEPWIPWSSAPFCRKWQKNGLRTLVLVCTMMVVWVGGEAVSSYVAIVGAVCCATLGLIIPSLLHIRICQPNTLLLCRDLFILAVGIVTLLVSTEQAIASWK